MDVIVFIFGVATGLLLAVFFIGIGVFLRSYKE
jgi:hypothetical protein